MIVLVEEADPIFFTVPRSCPVTEGFREYHGWACLWKPLCHFRPRGHAGRQHQTRGKERIISHGFPLNGFHARAIFALMLRKRNSCHSLMRREEDSHPSYN